MLILCGSVSDSKILNMLDFKVILDEVLSPLWQSRLSYVDDDLVGTIVLCLFYLSDPG